jgi:two-component system nitrogen regulation response regulator GlnG
MPVPSSVFTVLLLTADTEMQAQFKQAFKDVSVTVARDLAAVQKEFPRRQFDAVVVESRAGQEGISALPEHLNSTRTLVITGSRAVLKKALKMMPVMEQQNGHPAQGKARDASLEGYLEMKMGDFVKGMMNGSAKNLHPILISAVERPLITSALRETAGNQIRAAELLGLNRNTLRKKFADLHIPLKRPRSKVDRMA